MEANILSDPYITLPNVTVWLGTVEEGGEWLIWVDIQDILLNNQQVFPESLFWTALFGDVNAARQMSKLIHSFVD
jgi:hypothetical protein